MTQSKGMRAPKPHPSMLGAFPCGWQERELEQAGAFLPEDMNPNGTLGTSTSLLTENTAVEVALVLAKNYPNIYRRCERLGCKAVISSVSLQHEGRETCELVRRNETVAPASMLQPAHPPVMGQPGQAYPQSL
jgi:hypothetical protein